MDDLRSYRALSDTICDTLARCGYAGDLSRFAAVGAAVYDIVEGADKIRDRINALRTSGLQGEELRNTFLELLWDLYWEISQHIRAHCEDASEPFQEMIAAVESLGHGTEGDA